MKKIIIISLMFLSIFLYSSSMENEETVKIPDSAIRFRVLANSNSPRDQKIKEEIRDSRQKTLYDLLKSITSIREARKVINNNMENFNSILDQMMKNVGYSYTIDYGMHSFPEKQYKGVTYKAGNYESLLVTLGEGQGDNWWCVLFPPLCLIDTDNVSDNEYSFFVGEVIKNFFKNNK